jgi:chloramphenicol-sensitive protein RarD
MVGFLQYITPTMQFFLGVFLFREPFPPARLHGFMLVWAGLLVVVADSAWRMRPVRERA